jgi:two-component system, chemotaxis family, protein-glutamate methylesterase/glutaminase
MKEPRDFPIIVIGASAGGVEALKILVAGLPKDLQAAIFIAMHLQASRETLLPKILNSHGPLPVHLPRDQEPIQPGHIYVAPPGYHMLIRKGSIELSSGPKENNQRPAVDSMFRSAASAYGTHVIGVILTGALDDGTVGLGMVKKRGGTTVIQDPGDALYPDMPESARRHVKIDHSLPLDEMATQLVKLVKKNLANRNGHKKSQPASDKGTQGKLTPLTCPNCHGVMSEYREGKITEYKCQVGHAFSPQTMDSEHEEVVDSALWAAYRLVEERITLLQRISKNHGQRWQKESLNNFQQKTQEMKSHAALLKKILFEK